MKNIIIFGCGQAGRALCSELQKDAFNVVAILDSNPLLVGKLYNSVPVIPPKDLMNFEYDLIYTTGAPTYQAEMKKQLDELNITPSLIVERIDKQSYLMDYARAQFIEDFSKISTELKGNVAEAGVYQGHSAHYINKYFPDRKLYLFDTFESFNQDDMNLEKQLGIDAPKVNFLHTDISMVQEKLPFPKQAIFKKGYFPETTIGLENEKFCFVNADMDLYAPMYAALEFFYPRLVERGCLLLHDYFNELYVNVKKAVDDYEKNTGLKLYKLPIGDTYSMAIIK